MAESTNNSGELTTVNLNKILNKYTADQIQSKFINGFL